MGVIKFCDNHISKKGLKIFTDVHIKVMQCNIGVELYSSSNGANTIFAVLLYHCSDCTKNNQTKKCTCVYAKELVHCSEYKK